MVHRMWVPYDSHRCLLLVPGLRRDDGVRLMVKLRDVALLVWEQEVALPGLTEAAKLNVYLHEAEGKVYADLMLPRQDEWPLGGLAEALCIGECICGEKLTSGWGTEWYNQMGQPYARCRRYTFKIGQNVEETISIAREDLVCNAEALVDEINRRLCPACGYPGQEDLEVTSYIDSVKQCSGHILVHRKGRRTTQCKKCKAVVIKTFDL